MPDLATPVPCRRPELVSCPLGDSGSYLVRNRRDSESFQLGPEEHFLLARLDGTRTAEELRAAFAERFGEPLTAEELEDFLNLARERGLLQQEDAGATRSLGGRPINDWQEFVGRISNPSELPDGLEIRPTEGQRLAARLLSMAAATVEWPADLLGGTAQWVRLLKLRHFDFVPRPDDVFIVTYPRSGTTWMQMILYQLTTDGDMDFPHIYEYCPWFENSSRCAGGFEGRPSPRLFKSHLPHRRIPKGACKYVYVARDGKDVAVSYYHLYRTHNGYQGTFGEFFDLFLRGKVAFGSWFEHVKGWWHHRNDPNVLFLRYEDLLSDLEGCLRRVITFCRFDIPPERFPAILERCSFAFMKQHESQFDPLTGRMWEQGARRNALLRRGRTGEGKQCLNPRQAARFDKVFRSELGRTGIDFPAPSDRLVGVHRS
jgi:hypothetical protein